MNFQNLILTLKSWYNQTIHTLSICCYCAFTIKINLFKQPRVKKNQNHHHFLYDAEFNQIRLIIINSCSDSNHDIWIIGCLKYSTAKLNLFCSFRLIFSVASKNVLTKFFKTKVILSKKPRKLSELYSHPGFLSYFIIFLMQFLLNLKESIKTRTTFLPKTTLLHFSSLNYSKLTLLKSIVQSTRNYKKHLSCMNVKWPWKQKFNMLVFLEMGFVVKVNRLIGNKL